VPHPALLDDDELLAVCEVRFARRGGPGGQHRNKTETAAILTHSPSGISAEAAERRSQADNRRQALFRLRLQLALELRSSPPLDAIPLLWTARVRDGRLNIASEHADFPALLAIALDQLAAHKLDTTATGAALQITASQLTKLLRKHPPALAAVNAQRASRNLHPLR
jgi:hypothetical protein